VVSAAKWPSVSVARPPRRVSLLRPFLPLPSPADHRHQTSKYNLALDIGRVSARPSYHSISVVKKIDKKKEIKRK